jgi:hypothetical protein
VATGAITNAKFAAGAIDAAAVATGAIDADALAADAGTEIGTAVWATTARTLTAATNITSTGGTTVPQTGDSFARLGAPAGASVSADVAAVKTQTAAIEADTGTDGVVVAAASKTGFTLAATTGLGNQTANITGNLSGSVGSVTGAVGSVTGAVGSVTGAVGSVTGAVGSVAANGITATSIATDAINAAAVKADAVTKIQNGLATPTNITAGTITTATNVTTVNGLAANVITAASIAAGAIDNATFAADVGSTAYATNIIALAADKAIVNAALATQASVNTIDDFLDTEIAAILADTNELQTDWANGGRLDLILDIIAADTTTDIPALIADVPTVAEFEARTLVAADYTVVSDLGTVQTGDSFARLGAPAGASVSADVAAVKAQTAAIEADTQDLQTQVGTDGAGLTALPWNAAWDAEVQSECADAITAAAPIQADIRKVNNVTIDGAGTEGDPWGPAA